MITVKLRTTDNIKTGRKKTTSYFSSRYPSIFLLIRIPAKGKNCDQLPTPFFFLTMEILHRATFLLTELLSDIGSHVSPCLDETPCNPG